MIRITAEASPELQQRLANVTPDRLVKFLRGSVKRESQPAVRVAQIAAPVRSGLLRQSLGATVKVNRRMGEVFAIVGPRDNTVGIDLDGNLTVYTSTSLKSLMRNDAKKLRALHKKGITTVNQRTPFKYVYGIEWGVRRNGRLARHAGGAKMLERAYQQGSQPFIDGLARDLDTFLTGPATTAALT